MDPLDHTLYMPLEPARHYVDHIHTALMGCDAELRVWEMNPAAEALFEISARHSHGRRIHELCLDGDAIADCARQALDKAHTVSAYDLPVVLAPRKTVRVDLTVTPLRDDPAPVALLLEMTRTDRLMSRAREEQRADRHTAGREILRGLAHEIKNPLGGLRGAAQLLEREIADPELADYTGVIIREADRLQNLVDGMLGPRQPPQMERQNIHEALEHVRRLIEADLPDGISMIRDYDPSIPELEIDREQLIQVFFNLLGNATHAVAGGGTVTLRTRTQRLFTIGGVQHRLVLRVDVIDDGPGIDEDLLPRIFLPMVTSRADGSGMGLPIAQYLVHLHDGLIECESRPGETVFSVYLPLGAGDA